MTDMETGWEPNFVVRISAEKVGAIIDAEGYKNGLHLLCCMVDDIEADDEIYLGLDTDRSDDEETTMVIVASKSGKLGTFQSIAYTGPNQTSVEDREYSNLYLLMMTDGIVA